MHTGEAPEHGRGASSGEPHVVTAQWRGDDAESVARALRGFAGRDLSLVLLFCSPRLDVDRVAEAVRAAVPGPAIAGCTTAGEIGPAGYEDGTAVAVGLAAESFDCATAHIDDLAAFDEDEARHVAARMVAAVGGARARSFSLLLVDGLSGREERVARTCQRVLGDIPLVGGSAADDQRFVATRVLHDGRVAGGATWVVVATDLPFAVFRSSHFAGRSEPLVVTEADAERRIVHEINGLPAASEYARVLGLDVEDLTPAHFAAAPLVVRLGGSDHVRSIRSMDGDGSLTLFCAIDRGVVLRVGGGDDLVAERRRVFDELRADVGDPLLTLGFDCIHCKSEADQSQRRPDIERLFLDNAVVGFSSYGEQFVGSHVNQTLTGVVIGGAG